MNRPSKKTTLKYLWAKYKELDNEAKRLSNVVDSISAVHESRQQVDPDAAESVAAHLNNEALALAKRSLALASEAELVAEAIRLIEAPNRT